MLDQCEFPQLAQPYDAALRQAAAWVFQHVDDVIGVLAAGSIIRGHGDANSDIDTFVITQGAFRQRLQKRIHGVPFEIFINPVHQVRRYFQDEQRDGGPATLTMLATGHVMFQSDAVVQALRQQAQQLLAAGPQFPESLLTMRRYMLADTFENALDCRQRDPNMALLLIASVLPGMLNYHFYKQQRYHPRHKDLLATLREEAPALAALVAQFWAATQDERFGIVERIADITIGTRGFFEWETPPDPV